MVIDQFHDISTQSLTKSGHVGRLKRKFGGEGVQPRKILSVRVSFNLLVSISVGETKVLLHKKSSESDP